MKVFLVLTVCCCGLALGQGYGPPPAAPPPPPPPPPAAAPPPPAAPAPTEYPRIPLKPSNPYDIEGEGIEKGGEVSKCLLLLMAYSIPIAFLIPMANHCNRYLANS